MNLSTRNPQPATRNPIFNALTIDVEDYYMVSAFADVVKFEDWPKYESRVVANTMKIVDLLDEYDTKGTFFILGWVAEHFPDLVKKIHSAGHEIASHGYSHRLIYDMSPEQFRDDVVRSKNMLEELTGESVLGYRAASYSIIKESLWALDILLEEGFKYDSSIFPIYHDRYGVPGAERFPHVLKRDMGDLWEFPPSTFNLFGNNLPIGGGGYFRFLPSLITRAAIRKINEREKNPVIFYLHPWEIDADQPRIDGKTLSRIRHYTNLDTTLPKLKTILQTFKFQPISHFLA